ncbi:MAG: FecR domain-containing protein [Bacteroidales bacterium]|nr:FecR domain-containing protein [Bacteroidales bacterium]
MELRFIKYSIEELVDDKQFIEWILKGNKDLEWMLFIEENPEFRIKADRAREMILLLHYTNDVLDEEDVLEMWQNIDHFDQLQKQKVRTFKIRKSIYWAASFFLILSFGALSYIYLGGKGSKYQFVSSEIKNQSDEARLVLSNGEEIALRTKNSKISLNSNYELMINNDSIIDLSKLESESAKRAKMNEIVIPYGKRSVLYLADGTKVFLNSGTHLAFPSRFTGEKREVFLEGEAYFEVAKNKIQPFVVNTGELNIKVLGTHFNVSAYVNESSIETILLEGSVAVSKQTAFGLKWKEVILKPYQKASFDKKKNEVTVSEEPGADMYITWTKGWLQFSQESLQFIFLKLERYYNVEIKTSEKFYPSQLISGKLDLKESLDEVMKALADVAKIDYRIRGNAIYIEQN